MAVNETEIRSLVDDLVSAWNSRDLERFLGRLDEDVVWSDPAMLYGPATGKPAVREFGEDILRAFPDFLYRVREPICVAQSGSRCAVPWEIKATHSGRFDHLGFAPTNQTVTMRGVDVLEFVSIKVTRIETYFDVVPAAAQVLRLRPLAECGVASAIIVWLQRSRAFWLRLTTRRRGK
jgi:steroid delta-isomerase-like uncharacterized protein